MQERLYALVNCFTYCSSGRLHIEQSQRICSSVGHSKEHPTCPSTRPQNKGWSYQKGIQRNPISPIGIGGPPLGGVTTIGPPFCSRPHRTRFNRSGAQIGFTCYGNVMLRPETRKPSVAQLLCSGPEEHCYIVHSLCSFQGTDKG